MTRDGTELRPGPSVYPLFIRGPRSAFRWTAFVLSVTAFASAVPTPLYPVYEAKFGFSSALLGLVFGGYTLGVFLTLFLVAPRAEYVGRKRLLYLGMLITAIGAVTFALAPSVAWLGVARVVQGLAVGMTTSVATASMSDLEPYHDQHHVARVAVSANFGAFAVGVFVSGILVEYAPYPLQLVYVLPILASVVGVLALRSVPETATAIGARPSRWVQRISVPPSLRRPFWVSAGGIVACYAIYGLFAALVPSFLRTDLQVSNSAVQGAVVALMFGLAAATQLATGQVRDRRSLLVGFPVLLVALLLLVIILPSATPASLVVVTGLLGVAVGLTFMGSVTLVDRVAPEVNRGELLAGFYAAGYLALAVPTIGVAVASVSLGISTAGFLFGSILAAAVAILYVAVYRTPTPPGGGGRVRDTGPAP